MTKPKHLDDPRWSEILKRVQRGETYQQIGDSQGVTRQAIGKIMMKIKRIKSLTNMPASCQPVSSSGHYGNSNPRKTNNNEENPNT
jgi:hypothetical protein